MWPYLLFFYFLVSRNSPILVGSGLIDSVLESESSAQGVTSLSGSLIGGTEPARLVYLDAFDQFIFALAFDTASHWLFFCFPLRKWNAATFGPSGFMDFLGGNRRIES